MALSDSTQTENGKYVKLKLGINHVTNEEYHADTSFLSSSVLKLLAKDPAEYHKQYILGEKPTNSSGMHLELGSLVHTMLLEPHLVDEEYAFYPGDIRAGAAFKAFHASNPGKKILTNKVKAEAQALVTAARHRPEIMELLKGGFAEQSICIELLGVPLKMRADYIIPSLGIINDVKTTRHPDGVDLFKEAVRDYDYGLSAALYTLIAQTHYNRPFTFFFSVLSKQALVADLYKCSEATMAKGLEEVHKAMDIYKKCKASGIWKAETDGTQPETEQSDDGLYIIREV